MHPEVESGRVLEVQGARIPVLGFGTWQLEGEACAAAVEDALVLGYRHVDTAAAYGNEEAVGEGLRRSGVPRDEIFLATKVWRDDLDRRGVLASVEKSLVALRVDAIDLLLVHWPNATVPIGETLETMVRLREEGKIRHIGVSNFPPRLLEEALSIAPIVADQVEYHPWLGQHPLLELARARGVGTVAYCPLGRGAILEDPTIRSIAAGHGKTPAQVVLRWLVQQDGVAAIPRAAMADHRRENLEVFDFELTPDELASIHALDRGRRFIDPDFAPDWGAAARPGS